MTTNDSGFIYLAKSTTGHYKIGKSVSPGIG